MIQFKILLNMIQFKILLSMIRLKKSKRDIIQNIPVNQAYHATPKNVSIQDNHENDTNVNCSF